MHGAGPSKHSEHRSLVHGAWYIQIEDDTCVLNPFLAPHLSTLRQTFNRGCMWFLCVSQPSLSASFFIRSSLVCLTRLGAASSKVHDAKTKYPSKCMMSLTRVICSGRWSFYDWLARAMALALVSSRSISLILRCQPCCGLTGTKAQVGCGRTLRLNGSQYELQTWGI